MKIKSISLSVLLTLLFASNSSYAISMGKSICGIEDNRCPSFNAKIGRAFESLWKKNAACTITMIGKSCAISAGHCEKKLKYAEFNVPLSKRHLPVRSDLKDIYEIDQDSLVARFNKRHDFAVFKLKPNKITGEFAGRRQGYYQLYFDKPKEGAPLHVVGYGIDPDEVHNMTQQSSEGVVTDIDFLSSLIYHNVDTLGGNSGSPIILSNQDRVVGVHTWGKCYDKGGSNVGTLVKNRKFKKAIKKCLRTSISK
jgi:V8-like Glu-specific endopeptidase